MMFLITHIVEEQIYIDGKKKNFLTSYFIKDLLNHNYLDIKLFRTPKYQQLSIVVT